MAIGCPQNLLDLSLGRETQVKKKTSIVTGLLSWGLLDYLLIFLPNVVNQEPFLRSIS